MCPWGKVSGHIVLPLSVCPKIVYMFCPPNFSNSFKLETFYFTEYLYTECVHIIRIFIFLNFSITGCWTWSIFVKFCIDTYALCAYFLSQGRSFLFYMIFVDYQWCIFYQDLIPLIFSWQHHMWLPEMANFEQQISLYLNLWYQSTVWGHTLV